MTGHIRQYFCASVSPPPSYKNDDKFCLLGLFWKLNKSMHLKIQDFIFFSSKYSEHLGNYFLIYEVLGHPVLTPWLDTIDPHWTFGLRLKLLHQQSTIGLIIKLNWLAEKRNRKCFRNFHRIFAFQYLCYVISKRQFIKTFIIFTESVNHIVNIEQLLS